MMPFLVKLPDGLHLKKAGEEACSNVNRAADLIADLIQFRSVSIGENELPARQAAV